MPAARTITAPNGSSVVVVAVAWGGVALTSTILTYAMMAGGPNGFSWPLTIGREVVAWAFWVVVTPFIIRLARRFPLVGPGWPRTLGLHATVGLVLTAAFNGIRIAESAALGWMVPGHLHIVLRDAAGRTVFELFVYLAIVGLASAVDHARLLRDRDLKMAQLETHLLAAKLTALRAQLQPHFLFNTLHTVALLIRERDNDDALRVVLDLSELLRRVVDDIDTEQISLRRELAFLERYVDIERVRFDESLSVVIDADSDALDAALPPLLLQPIVENALRHGVSADSGRGTVHITARREHDTVAIEIEDNGRGFSTQSAGSQSGVGLRNIRQRLDALYPSRHRLEIATLAEGGTRVRLELPYERALPNVELSYQAALP